MELFDKVIIIESFAKDISVHSLYQKGGFIAVVDYLVDPEKGIIALPDVTKGTDLPMWPHCACIQTHIQRGRRKEYGRQTF